MSYWRTSHRDSANIDTQRRCQTFTNVFISKVITKYSEVQALLINYHSIAIDFFFYLCRQKFSIQVLINVKIGAMYTAIVLVIFVYDQSFLCQRPDR